MTLLLAISAAAAASRTAAPAAATAAATAPRPPPRLTRDIAIRPTAHGHAEFRATDGHDVSLHWKRFGRKGAPTRVLFIMGLAASHNAWQAQVERLVAQGGCDVVVFDNRGTGASSTPPGGYTTDAMASDAARLMDHVQWRDAHIVGFSMGGMIAMKLAALHAPRVRSLCLISTHLGGFFFRLPGPKGLSNLLQILAAPLVRRLPAGRRLASRMRSHLDLRCHFTPSFLNSVSLPPPTPRRRPLRWAFKRISRAARAAAPFSRASRAVRSLGRRAVYFGRRRYDAARVRYDAASAAYRQRRLQRLQARRVRRLALLERRVERRRRRRGLPPLDSNYDELLSHYEASREKLGGGAPGLAGQVAAVMRHRMSKRDVRALRERAVPKAVLHGREDIIVRPRAARAMARLLGAELHMLDANHMSVVEASEQVNALLLRHLRRSQKAWAGRQSRWRAVWSSAWWGGGERAGVPA